MHDIFGPGANTKERIIRDLSELLERITALRRLGLKVVLTSGTFDLTHNGHLRYLEAAKNRGDILVVGVDSDAKVRARKGPHRPVVPEDERMEIVCHSRHADLVFLKPAETERWELIKAVAPDVLVVTQETYEDAELAELRKICGEVVVLEPQATTSTTARVRILVMEQANEIRGMLRTAFQQVDDYFDRLAGDGKQGAADDAADVPPPSDGPDAPVPHDAGKGST